MGTNICLPSEFAPDGLMFRFGGTILLLATNVNSFQCIPQKVYSIVAKRLFTMLEFASVSSSGTDQDITPHTKKSVAQ